MANKGITKREQFIWISLVGLALIALLGTVIFSVVQVNTRSAKVEENQSQVQSLQSDYKAAVDLENRIDKCRSKLSNAEDAYDNYFSAFMGWTDEFFVMLDYGIFAADTVALIAIPQIAADGDDALESAKSSSCS